MRFEKWQALGNDYLIIEAAALPWELTPERARRLCDPHFGPGSDGVLLLTPVPDPDHVAELRIFNPDGSEAELSGNGARQACLYLRRAGWTEEDEFAILTKAGEIRPTIRDERTCALEMGRAATASPDYPSGPPDGRGELEAAGRRWAFRHVSIGNPQCAIAVGGGPEGAAELEELNLGEIGPPIERHELFPNRTNVSFYRVEDGSGGPGSSGGGSGGGGSSGGGSGGGGSGGGGSRVRARIFERGVGETLSSGTGASGAAVAALLDGAPSPLTVVLDGGELEVEVSDELDVVLTGWAEPIYAAELAPELVRALEDG